ncbi:hypothetical protein J6590_012364 [Homalodisca vitripennis]|nr:hypothetical protein J6590_012364 [Homalodisca vitripennis]
MPERRVRNIEDRVLKVGSIGYHPLRVDLSGVERLKTTIVVKEMVTSSSCQCPELCHLWVLKWRGLHSRTHVPSRSVHEAHAQPSSLFLSAVFLCTRTWELPDPNLVFFVSSDQAELIWWASLWLYFTTLIFHFILSSPSQTKQAEERCALVDWEARDT